MRYDIRAKVREYPDPKTGELKSVYKTIGSAWIGEKTNSIELDVIPVNWSGKAFLNEPYEKDRPLQQHEVLGKAKDTVLDDISDEPIDLSKLDVPF